MGQVKPCALCCKCAGDDQRGFAWTRALLGLPANEIHVCGDMSAIDLVSKMCQECGDEFEVQRYQRFTPLVVEEQLPNGYSDVRPGDCIVSFSRKTIYSTKKKIEEATGLRACVVYGSLPAETRRHQVIRFNFWLLHFFLTRTALSFESLTLTKVQSPWFKGPFTPGASVGHHRRLFQCMPRARRL